MTNLQLNLDENSLVKELVAQYLAHDGFVETAKAFSNEMHAEKRALKNELVLSLDDSSVQEDLDAANRQRKLKNFKTAATQGGF